jgi:hypothetical protein
MISFEVLKSHMNIFMEYGDALPEKKFLRDSLIPYIKICNEEEINELKQIASECYENNKFQKTNNYSYDCYATLLFYDKCKQCNLPFPGERNHNMIQNN